MDRSNNNESLLSLNDWSLDDLSNELIEWKNNLIVYRFALEEVNTKLKILNEEFQFIHNHNPIEHIKSRIKDPRGIMVKLNRKGLDITVENAKEHIHDIAGVRITCSFISDIYDIYEMLKKQSDIKIVEVKDYIENPKPNGYKSLHLIVKIPVFLSNGMEEVYVEVQIRTIAMDFWASLEHKIYYKFDKGIPNHLLAELKEAADAAHELDVKMKKIKDRVDIYQTVGDAQTLV
ncbi:MULTISPECIES: GTP pyrophosphokinase family protein [Bacillaceae]|uniref:GTP pyrophosphokinase n=1 Tax=Bacillaceae TaxID=186817 RepID=UPI001E35C7E0|nr:MULTISPECIES: GTP pyrophosphokinase family protein [Bacillaceae]MCE4050017.1 GTP pyrophosphokinase family protein [Bacillus sp. Au-Bac7]MCM3033797.1 GTP pyrophosphokinase family protein [Niallia sp. MER 6]MDL0435618.1 GTP pyrophosphokinase family protein [Niallia sp. SS-2023]UPO88078.1 GTP pyrophosphokinase family protein [Niallia sp. Man26]